MENTEERNVNEWKYYTFYVYKRFFGNYTIYTALMDTLIETYPKIPIKGRALYSRTNVFRVPAEALKVRKSKKYKRNYRSTLKVAD